ncbi:MAG: DUF998 domain-containing protein, partial [Candidatus Limnocylindrales bacterium]
MIHVLAVASALLATTAAALVVVLHGIRSGVDPVIDGVSAYALTPLRRFYRVQVVATGLGALLLTATLIGNGLAPGIAVTLLAVFGVSRMLIARFPTDPRGTIAFSRPGRLHVVLAAISFVTIAVAAPPIAGALA